MAQSQEITSSGSNLILSSGLDQITSAIIFQVEPSTGANAWTGSLQPQKKVFGSTTYHSASYTRLTDGAILTGSISSAGIFSLDATGCEVLLSHTCASGSVNVFTSLVISR